MRITAFFTQGGEPKIGLSPTIRIRQLNTNTLIITDIIMSEMGDGHYKYDFTIGIPNDEYVVRCDGTNTLVGSERYTEASFTFDLTQELFKIFDTKIKVIEPNEIKILRLSFVENEKEVFNRNIHAGIYDLDTKEFLQDIVLTYNFVTNSYEGLYTFPNTLEKNIQVVYRERNINGTNFAILEYGYIDPIDTINITTLIDVGKTWTTNEWQNKTLYLEEQEINIDANTNNTLTFAGNTILTTNHDYFIFDYKCNILYVENYKIDVIEDSDATIS